MTKNKKYRRLGVLFVLVMLLSAGMIIPTYAENLNQNTETVTELTCETLAEKYGLYIVSNSTPGEFTLIRDEAVASQCANNKEPKDDLKLIKINGVNQGGNQVISNSNREINFKAQFLREGNMERIIVTLQSVKDPNVTLDVTYEVEDEASKINGLGEEPNINYNDEDTCKKFRTEVAQMSQDAQKFMKDSVAYCWKANVPTGTNYDKKEITAKINSAKASWKAFNAENESQTPTFKQAFNSIKANAGKVPGHSITITNNPTFSAKCRYDYLKMPGAQYTNAYGEVINSDTDYYLNKDYYLGTQTTYSGADYEYIYHYAPGNTQTKSLNGGNPTCTRTCEEAVKLEYGPPIASKAGLCFEYKVKVTSYVTCKSTFTATPPQSTTNYCNPAPRCVSLSGVERKKPQAGPNEEFDSCIAECDGGKYTQACSKKCYNKVYAGKNGINELALNYETAKAEKLANNDYSLQQCLNDNSDGCYYYNGNTIDWKEKGEHNNYAAASLGRWYVEAHKTGYDITLCSKDGVNNCFIADTHGFKRKRYSSGNLCTDNCSWKTDCGKDVYLNPGTAAKDYKENEKIYEAARNACSAGVTCSSKTADITISINYDETSDSGSTKKTKIEFPYTSEKKDSISSKGKGNAGKDTTNNSFSTILDHNGCYTNADSKNWYLAEWSFPGTYIHNKTGEITFKVPDDTSGWYYEDQKFCMPLNAQSVNTKWWEWYQISNADFAKSCYTKQDIETELATKNNTSNGYNINASAVNFGYFGWNLNVDCFYALRNEICKVDDESTKRCCSKNANASGDATKGLENYVVRTIDRSDMFPNRTITGVVSENTRPIGFNWTESAKILEMKNPDYNVDPIALIQKIEGTADSLHSDDTYLDYQFHLTPTTLRKIRAYNNKYSYGTWNGKVVKKNGVYVYLSNLWNSAEGSIESNIDLKSITGAVLKTGDPGVNNE